MNIRKLSLWLALGAVALFVVVVVLIKLLVSPGTVAAQITPRLEGIFDRPVEIGETELTIFSGVGVRIHDIKVQNPPPFINIPLASVAAIDIKLKLLPLLVGSLQLKEINILGGQLYLVKDSTGAGNLTALSLERLRKAAQGDDENELVCRRIGLQNGRLLFRNDSTGTRLVLGKIDARLEIGSGTQPQVESDLRIDSLFLWSGFDDLLVSPRAGELTWQGSYALASDSLIINRCDWRLDKITGRLDGAIAKPASEPYFNMHIISEHTDLVDCYDSRIIAAIPVLRDMQLGGDLRIDIALRGGLRDSRTTTVRGKITVTDATAKLPDSDVTLKAKLIESDFNEQSLSVFTQEATIGAVPSLLRVAVDDFRAPTISGELQLSCDADVLGRLLGLDRSKQLSGNVSVSLSGFMKSADREQARMFGSVSLSGLSYHDTNERLAIDTLNLDLNLTGNDADLSRFDLSLGGYKVQMNGKLTDFAPYLASRRKPHKRPRFDFACSADSFALGLLAEGYRGSGDTTTILRLLDFFSDFDSRGSLQIGNGLVAGVVFDNLQASVSVVNRIVSSDSLTCDLFGRTADIDVVVDLNDLLMPEFDLDYVGAGIEVNDFLTGLTRFADHLYGRMDVQATFKGRGLLRDEILSSLTVDGKAKLSDGKVVNLNVADVFVSWFGIDALEHGEFDDLQTDFSVENRSLQFNPLTIKAGKLVYQIEGTVDFDGGFDCRVTRTLSKDDARTLSEHPDANGLATGRNFGKAVFRLTGSADTAFVQLEALLPKD
jgi:hypothetical protein